MYARYSQLSAEFGEIEKKLIEEFHLGEFTNIRLWEHLVRSEGVLPAARRPPLRQSDVEQYEELRDSDPDLKR
jgi:hypothetical protein